MRYLFFLVMICAGPVSKAQSPATEILSKDSLIIVPADASKGFHHDYILFLPKGLSLNKKTFLLVEPNNTGKLSDSIEVHRKAAVSLASVNSIGNNISTELKIPLLVPVFPRMESQPLMYTHALDRDVMLQQKPALYRLDLQLIQMIDDASVILTAMNIPVEPKIFMNGFSASATFTNRFSFLHPGKIKALAIGGFNGKLMIPQKEINAVPLNYPIGINDFFRIARDTFNIDCYRKIPQFIYMGKLDDNDAVQYDDAYSEKERKLINQYIGAKVPERYLACQEIYKAAHINATFNTYENIGHWTTGAINLEVIRFFLAQMKEN